MGEVGVDTAAATEDVAEHPAARRSVRSRLRAMPRHEKVLAAVLLLSALATLPYLRGDGNGYYAWLRSPVIDHDLAFRNEFERGDPTFRPTVFDPSGHLLPGMVTETGHVRDQWSVGPAVVWAPFFLAAHLFVLAARAAGSSIAADGFSTPYRYACAFGTALAASVGLLLSFRVARRIARPGPAIAGTIGIWLASSLPIYQYLLPFWPFGIAVLVSGALLLLWSRPGWAPRRWFWLGALSGFAAIVHPIGVVWAILPIASILGLDRGTRPERIRAAPWFVIGGLVGALPQMIGKAIVVGSPLDTGYEAQWRFTHPDVFRVLFGADHGALTWTPILVLALAGLVIVSRRDRRLGLGLAIVLVTMVYLVASYGTYEQSSFGNRFLVWFTPGAVVGLSAMADSVWSAHRRLAVAVLAGLIVWNVLFMFQWSWGLVPKRGPVDWGVMAKQQFTDAPSGLLQAGRLFFTDRAELIRIVQERDIVNLEEGHG